MSLERRTPDLPGNSAARETTPLRRRAAAAITAAMVMILAFAACEPTVRATEAAVATASSKGVFSFVSVVDRYDGAVLARTSNADTQVASESIMKLFLAAYYLKSYGGYNATPQRIRDQLAFIIQYSDNATTSALFTSSAIPTVAAWYGLPNTTNAHGNPGYWGAARITAADMARFLYEAGRDPQVGPWLLPTMAGTAAHGSGPDRNWNQAYGLNALQGEHGSKQGWGCDSYWTQPSCAIHSVGFTDKYYVAILQLSYAMPGAMPASATATARRIQASYNDPREGDFITDTGTGAVYRIAGGAPLYVSSWSAYGGPRPTRPMSSAQVNALRQYPVEGTFIRDVTRRAVYRIAGGAPVYVSSWEPFGGRRPTVEIDPAAIDRAGTGGFFNRLRPTPAEGTFIRDATTRAVYRIAGGAPLYVTSWEPFGGRQQTTEVDGASIERAGTAWPYLAMNYYPAPGTLVQAQPAGTIYRVGPDGLPQPVAPAEVPTSASVVAINQQTLERAGSGGWYDHLRPLPAAGT